MSATAISTANAITLKGSVDIITEFFNYGINSILYQRGLYPSDRFIHSQKYGLTLLVTNEEKLSNYLSVVLSQVKSFLLQKTVHRIVLAIIDVDSRETVERWQFNVDCDNSLADNDTKKVDMREVQCGIRDVIRQITASVTFLPLLEGRFSFDILLYTDKNADLPSKEWSDSNPHLIPNAEKVELRSFTTNIYKVNACVSYKTTDN